MTGWFAMRRGIHEHPLFKKRHDRLYVWSWMIATAAWRDVPQDAGGVMITVKRGQILTSYRQIEDQTGVGVKVVRNLLSALEKQQAIEITQVKGRTKPGIPRGTVRSLITICNYDKYQSRQDEGGTPGGTVGAQVGHTKEQDNNYNTLDANASKEADASEIVPVSILKKTVWESGKHYLSQHDVKNPGAMIGKWLKDNSDVEIAQALDAAIKSGTQDPVPYITAILSKPEQTSVSDLMAMAKEVNANR